ncbi:hypothetical protein GCM10020221_01670 [Streptomyces thioluteus]|uniref:Secreted protein n=1 Tax=Streptomyces thioluteus TaxID=66431 RepID=A0ABN3WD42_STRTU
MRWSIVSRLLLIIEARAALCTTRRECDRDQRADARDGEADLPAQSAAEGELHHDRNFTMIGGVGEVGGSGGTSRRLSL